MDKAQAIHGFWSGFGLPAYDEATVSYDAEMPYITYSVATDSIDNMVLLTASIWYRSTSWAEISRKADEVARRLGEHGFYSAKLDGGYVWIVKGSPFAQRMGDPDDDAVRRILLNVQAEFLTAY